MRDGRVRETEWEGRVSRKRVRVGKEREGGCESWVGVREY